jgi:hypothetical protein
MLSLLFAQSIYIFNTIDCVNSLNRSSHHVTPKTLLRSIFCSTVQISPIASRSGFSCFYSSFPPSPLLLLEFSSESGGRNIYSSFQLLPCQKKKRPPSLPSPDLDALPRRHTSPPPAPAPLPMAPVVVVPGHGAARAASLDPSSCLSPPEGPHAMRSTKP